MQCCCVNYPEVHKESKIRNLNELNLKHLQELKHQIQQ